MATYKELMTRSQQVRDEQNIGGNTALRVGQLLMDIVKYFYDTDMAASEYLEQHFAMVNDGTHLLNWQQSPIVILHTMGETYDEGDFSSLSQGENYYRAGFVMEANGQGGGINGETPKANVLYVNLANDTLYTWNGASFDAIATGGGGSISGDDILKNAYYLNGNLVLVFETESGDKTVTIPVTFDASNYVPTSRTVNGKALSNNITLSQSDIPGLVAALAAKVGYSDDEWLQVKAGAMQAATAVPNTTTVNGKRLNDNITIQMADIPGLGTAIGEAGKVKSVTINGTNHTPNSSGIVDLGTIQGAQGPKGDTGNVQVDGNGNVLIVNNLEEGGTGAALSAEMGKRLALLAGTYAEAWARSKVITVPFCWLWVETVDGAAISKPIWHKGNSVFVDATGAIINVPAASVPDAPTITGASNGSTVPKNTQITITPASGSALYYSIDGGTTYNVSDAAVTIKLETAGSVSIVAYCANNAGNSSNATLSVTVAGTAVPTFSPNGGEVARGGSVTISVPAGGELHYKIDSGSWITASGTSVSIPITGATTIQAYNIKDGDTSSTITKSFTMAALASPTFSVAAGTEFPATGGSVELTGPTGATIYYTTDGSTPTTSSTQYTGTAIAVTSAMTIKAIAHDNYGDSAVAEASYSVTVDHKFVFKIKLSADNSTEYVPVSHQAIPGFSSNAYTMSVDWGDGTVDNFTNKSFSQKECSHAYTGAAGDEKTITLRGSAIPALYFGGSASGVGANTYGNANALVAIIENTLTCDTYITINGGCSSLSANALSNNVGTGRLSLGGITSFPTGLLNHLSKTGITDFTEMFHTSGAILTAENMQELRTSLASATSMRSMFYGFKGTCALPNNLFDLIGSGVVTNVWALTHTAKSGLTGDAKALYDVLSTKVTSSASTANCFSPASLTNRDQVPNAWGGTAG